MNFKSFLSVIILINAMAYSTILFDIPVARQIVIFVYLFFMPGLALFAALKIQKSSLLDIVILSVGSSIALIMFAGFILNQLAFLLGILNPLSTYILLPTLSALTFVLLLVGYKRNGDILNSLSIENWKDFPIVQIIALISLPVISVLSVVFLRGLIPLIPIIIALLFVLTSLSQRIIPEKLYPLLIFSISISLTLMTTLIYQHIIGQDSFIEFFVYTNTSNNHAWSPVISNDFTEASFNAMLSITVLPTVYSSLMNINGELLFKILYPMVYSLVPVIIYKLLADQQWAVKATLTSFFIISSPLVFSGIYPFSLNRQLIGSFFFLLSIFVLVSRKFGVKSSRILMLLFGAAIIVSHYTMSVIYLVFIVLSYIVIRRKDRQNSILNLRLVLLLNVFNIFWLYVSQSGVPLTVYSIIKSILMRFNADLGSASARPSVLVTSHPIQTYASVINWVLYVSVHVILIAGIFTVLVNRHKERLDNTRLLILFSISLLILTIIVPNLSGTINFERFYQITILFMAPCLLIGGLTIYATSKFVIKRTRFSKLGKLMESQKIPIVLIAIILSAFFLSQYGAINYFTRADPQSSTMDWDRLRFSNDSQVAINFYFSYTPIQDVLSASWISRSISSNNEVYGDFVSVSHPLHVLALIPNENLRIPIEDQEIDSKSLVYLSYYNINKGYFIEPRGGVIYTNDLSTQLNYDNVVYNNRDNIVYFHG